MVSAGRPRSHTYLDYQALPEGVRAELLDGELFLTPRPGGRHVRVTSVLGGLIGTRFGLSHEGSPSDPGGWWILDEPECHLALDRRVVVPDLAGWRRPRLQSPPVDTHKFTVVPAWVCEVLSPSTASRDALIKMPRYLEAGVTWAWLVDPVSQRLDVFTAEDGAWREVSHAEGPGRYRLAPFEAVGLDLGPLWSDG